MLFYKVNLTLLHAESDSHSWSRLFSWLLDQWNMVQVRLCDFQKIEPNKAMPSVTVPWGPRLYRKPDSMKEVWLYQDRHAREAMSAHISWQPSLAVTPIANITCQPCEWAFMNGQLRKPLDDTDSGPRETLSFQTSDSEIVVALSR